MSRDYYGPGFEKQPPSDPNINRVVNWHFLSPCGPGLPALIEWMRRAWHRENIKPFTPYSKR